MPSFSTQSIKVIETCDVQLQYLFTHVVKYFDCKALDGFRDRERQNKLFNLGYSNAVYPQSKHNVFPSKAIDIVPCPVDWKNINRFYEFAGFVKATAIHLEIKVKWGGNFKNRFDGPHWELVD